MKPFHPLKATLIINFIQHAKTDCIMQSFMQYQLLHTKTILLPQNIHS